MADWPYSTKRWLRLRRLKLATNPLCESCLQVGRIECANAVDHKTPIANGGEAFPALDKLASLCTSCHSRKTAAEQAGKTEWLRKGCDERGFPLDRNHAWYKGR